MKSSKRLACFGALVLALVLAHAPVWPQGPTPSIGAPAPTSPPAVPDRPTLVPGAGDPVDGDEVTLPAKPAAILSGSSTWDEAFATLKKAFQRIEAELAKAGIGPAGRPVTVFTQTDDDGFRYDAMLPIDRAPEDRPPNLSPDIRFETTPSGRALRFVHRGPYDDIGSHLRDGHGLPRRQEHRGEGLLRRRVRQRLYLRRRSSLESTSSRFRSSRTWRASPPAPTAVPETARPCTRPDVSRRARATPWRRGRGGAGPRKRR